MGTAALFMAGAIGQPAQLTVPQAAATASETNIVAARSATLTQRPAAQAESGSAAKQGEPNQPLKTATLKTPSTPAPQLALEEAAPLPQEDARWARSIAVEPADPRLSEERSAMPEPVETAELRSKLERLQPDGSAQAAPAQEGLAGTDATVTATVAPRAVKTISISPSAPVAEQMTAINTRTASADAETRAAEAAAGVEAEEQVAAVDPTVEAELDVPKPASRPAASGRQTKVITHVNMRSGPDNGASVVTVVPAGGAVEVYGGCKHWCEISYDGKKGYVYKSFIGS